jgi:hypothetical protein
MCKFNAICNCMPLDTFLLDICLNVFKTSLVSEVNVTAVGFHHFLHTPLCLHFQVVAFSYTTYIVQVVSAK